MLRQGGSDRLKGGGECRLRSLHYCSSGEREFSPNKSLNLRILSWGRQGLLGHVQGGLSVCARKLSIGIALTDLFSVKKLWKDSKNFLIPESSGSESGLFGQGFSISTSKSDNNS